MAHFAELDENNTVLRVIIVHNNDCLKDGKEDEAAGIAFCQSLFGANTRWVQTSYNGNRRGCFAGKGFTYDAVRDVFVPPVLPLGNDSLIGGNGNDSLGGL
jgi:hypothetical protein